MIKKDYNVILTTNNRPDELRRAFASVQSQTCQPKKIIIVNTGDIRVDLCGTYELIECPGANGAKARNLGAKECRTKFIAFLDDDDEWFPDKIETQLQQIDKNTVMVCSPYEEEKQRFIPRPGNILDRNWIGSTSFPLLDRKCFEAVTGFDESFPANQEWDLWMRMLPLGNVSITEEPVGIKHSSKRSVTSNTSKRIGGWEAILNKHHDEYMHDPEAFFEACKTYRYEMYRRRSPTGFLKANKWLSESKKLLEEHFKQKERRSHSYYITTIWVD